MTPDNKPLSAAEIEKLRELEAKDELTLEDMVCALEALPRLLSMLQPPTDAAVLEAVEEIDLGSWTRDDEPVVVKAKYLRTLLSHVRAAQAQPKAESVPDCFGEPIAPMDPSAEYCEDCALFEKCKKVRAVQSPRLTEEQVAGCPDDIRHLGWAVAVHNDYKLNGVKHTFWLFTKGDRCVKGEGLTDAEALNGVRSAISAFPGVFGREG